MKKTLNIYTLLAVFVLLISSCSSISTLADGKKIDKQLVGFWEGSENDKQLEGMKKEWKMTRNSDGTFLLSFKTSYEGEVDEFTEAGKWWVEGTTFYEYHSNSEKTDHYKYTVLNKDEVKFEMISTELEFANTNYVFIDKRVSNSKLKDGLSIENAIKVGSISEEYDYVRKNCPKCQIISQSLINNKKKSYDMLVVKNQKGEEVSYYFDISSFFGKW